MRAPNEKDDLKLERFYNGLCPDCGSECREWNGLDGTSEKCTNAECGTLILVYGERPQAEHLREER